MKIKSSTSPNLRFLKPASPLKQELLHHRFRTLPNDCSTESLSFRVRNSNNTSLLKKEQRPAFDLLARKASDPAGIPILAILLARKPSALRRPSTSY